MSVLAGWLKTVDASRVPVLVRLAESLASAVDRDTSESCPSCKRSGANAALWREYRTVLGELTAALEVSDDDGEASLLRLVSTPVRNKAKAGKTNTRSRSRGDRGDVGKAADAAPAADRRRRTRAG